MSSTTFADLGVPSFICDALEQRGITQPFAIQAATVADGLAGRDVCGRAPTGSGKTLAFGVPLVATTERARPGLPHALVLAPTRELAEQITSELRTFAGRLRVDAVYGGVGYGKQLNALRRGVDILVACPGRLEDLIERGDVALGEVRSVVLDEADRMADMGFMPAVKRLLDQMPGDRRTMLFSATLDGDVAELTRRYQSDPVRHEVGDETPDVTAATHRFVMVERTERNPVVADVINGAWPSIVFTRTRHGADRLAKQLGKLGYQAAPIHGGLSQNARQRALDNFTKGRVHALVATDVAARGIHVDGVASVVHYDPPEDHKTYVHRAGRTARAGAGGLVVSLVQQEQRKDYRRMQRQIGLDEPFTDVGDAGASEGTTAEVPDLPPMETAPKPAPKQRPNGRRRNAPNAGRNGRNRDDRNDRRDRSEARKDRYHQHADGHRHSDGGHRRTRDDRRDDGRGDWNERRDRAERHDRQGRRHERNDRDDHRRDDRTSRRNDRADRRDDRDGDRTERRGRDERSGAGRSRPAPSTGNGSKRSSGSKRGPKQQGPSGSKGPKQNGPQRSGTPKANNRKARRAHLQWDR